ncbi:MAG: Serine/threonine-protein kinase smg1 [Alectoria sarmentosa]|nr:MAG: Serine/threonine-protein kinase smg1 [Alectoria sarmentosa]
MPQAQPELKKVLTHPANLHSLALANTIDLQYLDKRLFVQLNGSRRVIGVLRGYDVFLNIVLDEAVEEKAGGEKVRIGMVVIRGNSVVMLEALERIGGGDRDRG